jgi:hypothetical protein
VKLPDFKGCETIEEYEASVKIEREKWEQELVIQDAAIANEVDVRKTKMIQTWQNTRAKAEEDFKALLKKIDNAKVHDIEHLEKKEKSMREKLHTAQQDLRIILGSDAGKIAFALKGKKVVEKRQNQESEWLKGLSELVQKKLFSQVAERSRFQSRYPHACVLASGVLLSKCAGKAILFGVPFIDRYISLDLLLEQQPAVAQGKRKNLNTSNVAKYPLNTQVGTIGDGSMNGWWVVMVRANNGGTTGPGALTLSSTPNETADLESIRESEALSPSAIADDAEADSGPMDFVLPLDPDSANGTGKIPLDRLPPGTLLLKKRQPGLGDADAAHYTVGVVLEHNAEDLEYAGLGQALYLEHESLKLRRMVSGSNPQVGIDVFITECNAEVTKLAGKLQTKIASIKSAPGGAATEGQLDGEAQQQELARTETQLKRVESWAVAPGGFQLETVLANQFMYGQRVEHDQYLARLDTDHSFVLRTIEEGQLQAKRLATNKLQRAQRKVTTSWKMGMIQKQQECRILEQKRTGRTDGTIAREDDGQVNRGGWKPPSATEKGSGGGSSGGTSGGRGSTGKKGSRARTCKGNICIKKTTDPSGFCATHREAAGIPSMEQAARVADISKEALVAFFTKHNPERIPDIDETMEVFAGKSDLLCAKLEEKYGESPRSLAGSVAIIPAAAPIAAGKVVQKVKDEKTSDGSNGSDGKKTDASWFGLGWSGSGKKGDASSDGGKGSDTDASPVRAQAPSAFLTKYQLIEFYTKHNAEALKDVDETWQVFEGKHELLCEKLEEKYGESPTKFSGEFAEAEAMGKTEGTARR